MLTLKPAKGEHCSPLLLHLCASSHSLFSCKPRGGLAILEHVETLGLQW